MTRRAFLLSVAATALLGLGIGLPMVRRRYLFVGSGVSETGVPHAIQAFMTAPYRLVVDDAIEAMRRHGLLGWFEENTSDRSYLLEESMG